MSAPLESDDFNTLFGSNESVNVEPQESSSEEEESDDENQVELVLEGGRFSQQRLAQLQLQVQQQQLLLQQQQQLQSQSQLNNTPQLQQQQSSQQQTHPFKLPLPNESLYELEIDSMTEKPWTRPGADLSDWFNYGFDEHTWKGYARRQLMLRQQHEKLKQQHSNQLNTQSSIDLPQKRPLDEQNGESQSSFKKERVV